MLHYDRKRRAIGGGIECIFGKTHVADLAIKFENDRILRWAGSKNTRNNFRNTLPAELSLPIWNYTGKLRVTDAKCV
jgi:hypothetical protein